MTNNHVIKHEEIARLAYMNWQQDGCPLGRDLAYWLEAEHQIKASRQLLVEGVNAEPRRVPAAAQSGPKKARRLFTRPSLARQT